MVQGMTIHRFSFPGLFSLGAVLLLAAASPARAGERTVKASAVPDAVHEAVKKNYPDARAVRYTREKEGGKITYEVTLRVQGRVTDVGVTSEGQIVAEEERISADELPLAVAKSFAASPQGHGRVKRVERVVEGGNRRDPRFEILVQDGSVFVEMTFDAAGNLVSQERTRHAD
jgi:hypothetical protein